MSARASPAPGAAALIPILHAPTPPAWVEDAVSHLPELLLDHANCEKKAASSALALMFTYPEDRPLARLYQELAASEARHFQVYTGLAGGVAPAEWQARLAELASREAQLVTTPERMLRFHSGPLHCG